MTANRTLMQYTVLSILQVYKTIYRQRYIWETEMAQRVRGHALCAGLDLIQSTIYGSSCTTGDSKQETTSCDTAEVWTIHRAWHPTTLNEHLDIRLELENNLQMCISVR